MSGVSSHKGPVLVYIAACGGPCSSISDYSSLKWVKIYERGVIQYNFKEDVFNGKWATDILREQGNKWSITMPPNLASGEYVLRHELIALHGAFKPGNVQVFTLKPDE